MFKNPGKKVSVIVKVMFWVLSVMYAIFACGFALINTFMLLAFDAALVGASGSMGSTLGNNNAYSGGGSVLFIIITWVMAILSIIPVVLILYWVSLFLLTVAEMNTELKETKETIRDIENNMHGYGGTQGYFPQPEPVYSQPTPQQMPYYTPSQPYYETPSYEPPKPAYVPPQQTFSQPQPIEPPVQNSPVVEPQMQPAPEPQAPPSAPEPATEPVVTPANTEISGSPKPMESKEDILSKYGSSGNYYR